jgi:uncharacterized RDD family membrane protein YckC
MAGRREDPGSWREGTPEGTSDRGDLNLPDTGPGSRAGIGRRLLALAVDWGLSLSVSAVAFPAQDPAAGGPFSGAPLATLAVFGLSTAVLVALLGHTIGHRLVGIRVVRVRDLAPGPDGAWRARPPGVVAGVVRTLLLCLVLPAAVWDRDGRGLHDLAAGTVAVRR